MRDLLPRGCQWLRHAAGAGIRRVVVSRRPVPRRRNQVDCERGLHGFTALPCALDLAQSLMPPIISPPRPAQRGSRRRSRGLRPSQSAAERPDPPTADSRPQVHRNPSRLQAPSVAPRRRSRRPRPGHVTASAAHLLQKLLLRRHMYALLRFHCPTAHPTPIAPPTSPPKRSPALSLVGPARNVVVQYSPPNSDGINAGA